jgi:hypothetical protein
LLARLFRSVSRLLGLSTSADASSDSSSNAGHGEVPDGRWRGLACMLRIAETDDRVEVDLDGPTLSNEHGMDSTLQR